MEMTIETRKKEICDLHRRTAADVKLLLRVVKSEIMRG
jgi:hypothetical protein